MKGVVLSTAYQRDLRKMKKRGKNMAKLDAVVKSLMQGEELANKHKPHPLKGLWKPKWDCHIEPDWILIYEVTKDNVLLARTGTHADLF